jgi:hypothetical protein
MLVIQNESMLDLIKLKYTVEEIKNLSLFLKEHKTLHFSALRNGLFPAAKPDAETLYTGYKSIWVRDNVYIAHAHYICGDTAVAIKNVNTLKIYFGKHQFRFKGIVAGECDAQNPMNRPHIRFNGENLKEIDQKWAHAQNDALGYFLWLYCKLALDDMLKPEPDDLNLLMLFPRYWEAIRYWEDEDSGHWEETRKISASSIGAVVTALSVFREYLEKCGQLETYSDSIRLVDDLIEKGWDKLNKILPYECIQSNPNQYRRFDSALLFLIYPLNILSEDISNNVLQNVIDNLQGDYGIRRYIGDSYWSADYKKQLIPEARTVDFSEDLSARDALLKPGEEAQWCIFDPIISIIYGLKFQRTGEKAHLEKQTHYINRALGQITGLDCPLGEFLCPESYYLEDGRYVPSDPTPLLWTQANLMAALKFMEKSLSRAID